MKLNYIALDIEIIRNKGLEKINLDQLVEEMLP